MQKMTIKAYAVKHKLSIFNVMKMVKSGKLNIEIITENENEITYILLDDVTEKEVKERIVPIARENETTLKEMVTVLQKEVKLLREEVDVLKKKL